jgi:beta-glucosidase
MVDLYDAYPPGFSVVQEGDLEIISQPIDFLGVNFYGPGTVMGEGREEAARAAGFNVGPRPEGDAVNHLSSIGVETPGRPKTAMGWEVDASGLRELLVRIKDEYTSIPLYITENGAAYYDYVSPDGAVQDPERVEYLRQHLEACLDAVDDGVNLQGYFVWSLLDNFEWGFGYSRRFGIVWVDYDTGRRIPKSSFHWYGNVIRTGVVPPALT